MTEKLYTAAEVAEMIAAEKAKLSAGKAVRFVRRSGTTKAGKPFSGVQMTGDFFPVYLSIGAATALVANIDGLKAALAEPTPVAQAKVEGSSLSNSQVPRLVAKAK